MARRVLTQPGGQDVTHDDIIHRGVLELRTLDQGANDRGAEGNRRNLGERAHKATDGRTGGGDNHGIRHVMFSRVETHLENAIGNDELAGRLSDDLLDAHARSALLEDEGAIADFEIRKIGENPAHTAGTRER